MVKVFHERDVGMTYLKSKLSNTWADTNLYEIDLSIYKQTSGMVEELSSQLYELGAVMEESKPIRVPWFPRSIDKLELLGAEAHKKSTKLTELD